jgi:hypothetical protein
MIINILLITLYYIKYTYSYSYSYSTNINSDYFNSDYFNSRLNLNSNYFNSRLNLNSNYFNSMLNFNSRLNLNSNYFNSNYLNSNYFNSNYLNSNYFNSNYLNSNYFNSNYLNSNYFNSNYLNSNYFNSEINSNKYITSKNSQNYYSNILTLTQSSLVYKYTYNSNNYLTVIQSIPSTYKSTYSYNSNSNSNNYLTIIQSIPSLYISIHSYKSNCNLILYPTIYPTLQPTMNPTIYPTFKPTTFNPTLQPSKELSKEPTLEPTKQETAVLSFSINLELLNMSSIDLDESVKNSILLANANSMNISIIYQRWKNVSILHNQGRRRLLYNLYVETETVLPLDGKYKNIDPLILYNKLITEFSDNINSGNYITLLYSALSYYNSTQINIVIGSFIISQPIITYPNKTIDNNESKDKPFNYLLVLIPLVVVSSITILFFIIKYYKQNIINFLDKSRSREDYFTLSNLFESNRINSLLLYKSESVSDFDSDSYLDSDRDALHSLTFLRELDNDSFSDSDLTIFQTNNCWPEINNQSIKLSDISCNLALTSLRKLYNDSFSDLPTVAICAEYPLNRLEDDLHFCPINLLDPVTNVSQASDLTNYVSHEIDIILEITETDK